MRNIAAIGAGTLLFAASLGLLAIADEATDAAAIAGGTGLVVGGALLGLTLLAWRWRDAPRSYASTVIDPAGFYDDLAATFDQTTETYDDTPPLHAAN
jgi:hypothetical protein